MIEPRTAILLRAKPAPLTMDVNQEDLVVQELLAIFDEVQAEILEAYNAKTDATEAGSRIGRLRARLLGLASSSRILAIAKAAAARVQAAQAGQLRRILGVDPRAPGDVVASDRFERGLDRYMTQAVGQTVDRAIDTANQGGDPTQTIEAMRPRVELVGRDQTQKLFGQTNQIRQQNLGVQQYIWTTQDDGRVRGRKLADTGRHWQLHRTAQSWASPPVADILGNTAHPGEQINCRCVAQPNVAQLFRQPRTVPSARAPRRNPRPIPAARAPRRPQGRTTLTGGELVEVLTLLVSGLDPLSVSIRTGVHVRRVRAEASRLGLLP